MQDTFILVLRILGILIALAGVAIIFAAPRIVDKKNLADKKTDDPRLSESLTPEDRARLRRESAVLDIKLRGLLLAAPGFVLILIAFR